MRIVRAWPGGVGVETVVEATRVGPRAALAVLRELSGGAYPLPCLETDGPEL